jgi:hypothetical protein
VTKIELTPEMEALAQALTTTPRGRTQVPPRYDRNKGWRDELRGKGGRVTSIALSAAAAQVVAHRMSQTSRTMSQVICDALLSPDFQLEGEARAAADELRRDWPLESDAEVITLSVRWLAWHIRQQGIDTLEFGE